MRVTHFSLGPMTFEYFRNLAEGLPCHGVEVDFVVLGPDAERGELPREVDLTPLRAADWRHLPVAVARLRAYLRRRGTDVLHVHLFRPAVAATVARLPSSVRLAITRHHADQHWLLRKPVHRRLDRATSKRADVIFAPSDFVRSHLIRYE